MRARVVVIDAAYEAILGTALLLGAAFGSLDGEDFPAPAATAVTAAFGAVLILLAWALLELVSRDAVTDQVLTVLAAGNAAFAVLLAVWAIASDGFSTPGSIATW